MRTTLNLDDDVAERLTELARRRGTSVSRVANELVRAGLRATAARTRSQPYDPPVLRSGRALVDVTDIAAALERLEDE
ncbi:MAG TPA: ribbon-helix-helix protein, CopG family [Acidimicrobiales bacterium]|jgi:hypothetical protein|nr:ribbon-helix-helix protein, CopG family [Acidimicrobiales bacterium]